jgi:SAM-dependent methyltransferase
MSTLTTPSVAPRPTTQTLARTLRLFQLFRVEQTDPDRFYTALAEDSVQQLSEFIDLRDRVVIDVGSGPGYFAEAFDAAGARYFGMDVDVEHDWPNGSARMMGSGTAIPLRSNSADLAYASNIIEHLPDPWLMANETVRVTRPGGIVFLSFTLWWSLHGGHETAPWHYLGGGFARRRFRRKHGREPKNRFGESLFAYTASDTIRWARRQTDADVVAVFPRYHPRWLHWIARVPVVREVATWNLAVVLRKRDPSPAAT